MIALNGYSQLNLEKSAKLDHQGITEESCNQGFMPIHVNFNAIICVQ